MDKILTVREPYASALVHGIKKVEYRSWKIPAGVRVWIHAALQPGLPFPQVPAWLREHGEFPAADYMEWTDAKDDRPRPPLASTLAQAIYDSKGLPGGFEFPFGRIVGWCVFGESRLSEGAECKLGRFANPVESFHALRPDQWRVHKGSLGLMPFGGIS
jgi:hypothetical protein